MSIYTHAAITWTNDTAGNLNTFNQEIKEKMTDIDTAYTAEIAARTAVDAEVIAAIAYNIPAGVILMWAGSIASIPAGWHICDGAGGTIDLRNKFIVGAGSTYAVAATGGEATHTLITAEMPAHTHNVGMPGTSRAFSDGGANQATYVAENPSGSTGGGGAHENRPPYYALAYIQKV